MTVMLFVDTRPDSVCCKIVVAIASAKFFVITLWFGVFRHCERCVCMAWRIRAARAGGTARTYVAAGGVTLVSVLL